MSIDYSTGGVRVFAIFCSTVFQIVAFTETSPFMLERISTHSCVHLVPYSRYRNVCKGHLGSRKIDFYAYLCTFRPLVSLSLPLVLV